MRYLGDNLYWFPSEEDYQNYLFTGGHNGTPLSGSITNTHDGQVWAIIIGPQ
jgi:hypothetical protein